MIYLILVRFFQLEIMKKVKFIPLPCNIIEFIEINIDNLDKFLPKMTNFILPGGSVLISNVHICRTICRRAERNVVAILKDSDNIKIDIDAIFLSVQYLNRLSDYFFILARWFHFKENIGEILWKN